MKKKLYKCKYVDCETEQTMLSKGLCTFHRYKQKGNQVKNYIIKQQTAKNKVKKQEKRVILEPFYKYHYEKVTKSPFCDNCGVRIQGNLNNLAHILPKRNFGGNPEVMGELDNCLYLCASINGGEETGCHERFDRIQGSSKVYLMPCFILAVEKYSSFKEKVTKYTKYVQIFNQWLEKDRKNDT